MDRYKDYRDEEIVKLAKKDDEAAFGAILDRYKEIVKIKAAAFFIAGGDHDDIIQEGMIGLFKAVRDYDESKDVSFNSFAQLCIGRQIATAIKSASSKKYSPLNTSVPIPEIEEDDNTEHAESPENILIDKETAESMESDLRRVLSPFENDILDMLLKDRNYGEIAENMGIDKKSVDNGMQRIKRKMKILKGEQNQR